jgi:hypothetical protein
MVETQHGTRPRCDQRYAVTVGLEVQCNRQRDHGVWQGGGQPVDPTHTASLGEATLSWTTSLRDVLVEDIAWYGEAHEGTFRIDHDRDVHWHVIDGCVVCVDHQPGDSRCMLCEREFELVDRPVMTFEDA